MFSPAPPPLPPGLMANFRLRQGSIQPSSFLCAIWVGVCALGMGLLACLFTLVSIQCQLATLREELAQLRGELATKAGESKTSPLQQRPGNFLASPVLKLKSPTPLERRRREVAKEQPRQRRKQSVLHLIPAHQSSNYEENETEIWWEPFLEQGRALKLSGREVVVKHTGLYFVYSQVLFHDPTFTMGQVLWRVAVGRPDQILFRCVQSMPAHPGKAYNSCYSGGPEQKNSCTTPTSCGIFHLQHGDRLNVRIPRFNATFDVSAHGTFLGVLRL